MPPREGSISSIPQIRRLGSQLRSRLSASTLWTSQRAYGRTGTNKTKSTRLLTQLLNPRARLKSCLGLQQWPYKIARNGATDHAIFFQIKVLGTQTSITLRKGATQPMRPLWPVVAPFPQFSQGVSTYLAPLFEISSTSLVQNSFRAALNQPHITNIYSNKYVRTLGVPYDHIIREAVTTSHSTASLQIGSAPSATTGVLALFGRSQTLLPFYAALTLPSIFLRTPQLPLSQLRRYSFISTWFRYRSILRQYNIRQKNTRRKYSLFYTYRITKGFLSGPIRRKYIPELPFAIRGTFWQLPTQLTPVDVANVTKSEDSVELRRALLPGTLAPSDPVTFHLPFSTTQCPSYSKVAASSRAVSNLSGRSFSLPPKLRPKKSEYNLIRRPITRSKSSLARRLWSLSKSIKKAAYSKNKALRLFSQNMHGAHLRTQLRGWGHKFLSRSLNARKKHFFTSRPKSLHGNYNLTSQQSGLRPLPRGSSVWSNLTSNPTKPLALGTLSLPTATSQKRNNLAPAPFNTPHLGVNLPAVLKFWRSNTLLKYVLAGSVSSRGLELPTPTVVSSDVQALQLQLSTYFFGSASSKVQNLNLWVVPSSNYALRKRLLRFTSNNAFLHGSTMWCYRALIRFLENCTGRKVALNYGPFVDDSLTFGDKALINIWGFRIMGFQRMLGHKIFVKEALMLIAVSLRLKDPTFLANWIRAMLYRMSFWKFRLLFRYIKFLLQHIFKYSFDHFQFKGFKLRLKGKISVAGNARTRTLFYKVGDTSHSKMDNRVAYDLSFVGTFTGVLGFKLWFFY